MPVSEEMLEDWEEDDGIDPPSSKDLMFDPWATVPWEALEARFADPVRQLYAVLLQENRGKPLRADVSLGIAQIIPTIIANLMPLHKDRPEGSRLVVPMGRQKVTRYDRPGFRRLPEVVKAMEAAGLIIKHPHVFREKRTAIEARGDLKALLLRADIGLGDIARADGEEIIEVTARPNIKRIGSKKLPKVIVDYEDTETSIRLRGELDEVNRFLSSRSVTLRGNEMPAFRLVRRFALRQIGDPVRFDLHGRLYGGFWMNMKASEREHLRIDGEPIADLDFSGMFPNLAYRHVGKVPPPGDLYAIPGLEGHRDGAKAALSAFLCYDTEMKSLPSRLKVLLPEGWTASRVKKAVAAKHPYLVPLFGADFGLDLMFTESRILMATLQRLMVEDAPALPMHDGIMVPCSKAEVARVAMEKTSEEITGASLTVTMKQ